MFSYLSTYFNQGQASGMDWTLTLIFWESETSRDIKKKILYHLNIFNSCIDFQI